MSKPPQRPRPPPLWTLREPRLIPRTLLPRPADPQPFRSDESARGEVSAGLGQDPVTAHVPKAPYSPVPVEVTSTPVPYGSLVLKPALAGSNTRTLAFSLGCFVDANVAWVGCWCRCGTAGTTEGAGVPVETKWVAGALASENPQEIGSDMSLFIAAAWSRTVQVPRSVTPRGSAPVTGPRGPGGPVCPACPVRPGGPC